MQIKYLTNNLNFIPERFRKSISIDDHKKSIEYAKDKLDHRIKRNIVEILFLGSFDIWRIFGWLNAIRLHVEFKPGNQRCFGGFVTCFVFLLHCIFS